MRETERETGPEARRGRDDRGIRKAGAGGTADSEGSLTDVEGLLVGHAHRLDDGWLSGTTVVLAPPEGVVAGVDVRGGGPGTRETDALDPGNLVDRIHAIVLSGGSAFGLAAADGVTGWLAERERGYPVGPAPHQVVPVVPAAVLFDLGRGGKWTARPDAALGRIAAEAAGVGSAEGNVGAGAGAVAGDLKGGVGTASTRLPSGVTVAALVAVNPSGSVVDPGTGALWAQPLRVPSAEVHTAARRTMEEARRETERLTPNTLAAPLNTTLAVVATDAALDPAGARKLATTAHDGLARAIRPVHLLSDGDTVFGLATGARALPKGEAARLAETNAVLAAGADVLCRAVVRGILAAESVRTPGGVFPSHRELYGARGPGGETARPGAG
ncbi:P1 family peptidase [Streptomyces sp. ST2-7A]|uniref:P1 family peptidase n=1 Tax=Streptomyces sp. ST2-7A TaxID=2907214 RepID=UPI001F1712FD|nr:P1 family peptidase [Streptomyces sp. ST2-7A]MCE7078977.1 P1 family peptidase [Streptomyces sp. ST2-7A]